MKRIAFIPCLLISFFSFSQTVDELDAKGGFMKKKEDPETRACAAMALGRIGSQAAKAALQKASQDKEPLVKNAVSRALRGDRASGMFRAGETPA